MEHNDYNLDIHSQFIIDEYRDMLPIFMEMEKIVIGLINKLLADNGLLVEAVISRVKTEKSLAGKLAIKGQKYSSLTDITDILGTRIIAFYSDDVDKTASFIEKTFNIDWENSVDKRKMHRLDSFGYMSLHYICSIPESLYHSDKYPQINDIRFEVQMRSSLQNIWANMEHDTGYKSNIEIPDEYKRMYSRLAGILELADEEFSRIKNSLADYRRRIQTLVSSGRLEEVRLDIDTYKSYIATKPFEAINSRIASINHAEIQEMSFLPFFPILKEYGMETLKDIAVFIRNNEDDAYRLAVSQLADTDLDIIASTIGLQNLLIVATLKNGGGKAGLRHLFDIINGVSVHNDSLAQLVYRQAGKLPFMNKL